MLCCAVNVIFIYIIDYNVTIAFSFAFLDIVELGAKVTANETFGSSHKYFHILVQFDLPN